MKKDIKRILVVVAIVGSLTISFFVGEKIGYSSKVKEIASSASWQKAIGTVAMDFIRKEKYDFLYLAYDDEDDLSKGYNLYGCKMFGETDKDNARCYQVSHISGLGINAWVNDYGEYNELMLPSLKELKKGVEYSSKYKKIIDIDNNWSQKIHN